MALGCGGGDGGGGGRGGAADAIGGEGTGGFLVHEGAEGVGGEAFGGVGFAGAGRGCCGGGWGCGEPGGWCWGTEGEGGALFFDQSGAAAGSSEGFAVGVEGWSWLRHMAARLSVLETEATPVVLRWKIQWDYRLVVLIIVFSGVVVHQNECREE